jgi:hypothetical protein
MGDLRGGPMLRTAGWLVTALSIGLVVSQAVG